MNWVSWYREYLVCEDCKMSWCKDAGEKTTCTCKEIDE